jgi:hypothetical protein
MSKTKSKIRQEAEKPVAEFAKKNDIYIPSGVMAEAKVMIPPVYYWEDVVSGKSVLMTMAFQIYGLSFGMSFEIDEAVGENVVKKNMLRQKLFVRVKQSLDVLLHHGRKILDRFGNIDMNLVKEQEALRYKYDQHWQAKVAAFNKLVKIAPITREKAKQLGLLK